MSIRVRFLVTWSFNTDQIAGTWDNAKDFQRHAATLMLVQFQGYKPEMSFTPVSHEDSRTGVTASIVWDVNLDGVPGAWHTPDDHVRAIETHLNQVSYTTDVKVDAVLRHVPFDSDEIMDHGAMFVHSKEIGMELDKGDYPVFIPETHPDWPEANEVFLQDGHWFWVERDIENDRDISGPAAGPQPERLYTEWTAETRDVLYGRFKAKMDREFPIAQ
jgi:hypothetical protein